jgi:FtsZ-interacting cell division protein ZipA
MDKWLILTVLGVIGVVSIYFIGQWDNRQHSIQEEKDLNKFRENQRIIIDGINQSLYKTENQTRIILNNMSIALNDTRSDAHANREILEEIKNELNITVGKISELETDQPKIIPSE